MKKLLFICLIIVGQTLYAQNNAIDFHTLKYSKEWQIKADNQDPIAQFAVGYCYHWGIGIKQDYKEAISWYKKAITQNNSYAMFYLGQCYEFGDGVRKNIKEAFKWYEQSAKAGYDQAMLSVGRCYESGRGVKTNLYEAFNWYEKSAKKGNSNAMLAIGKCYEYGKCASKDIKKSILWYETAAEIGDIEAMESLGSVYFYGVEEQNFPKNYTESLKWYLKYIENTEKNNYKSIAAMKIGHIYRFGGYGVPLNYGLALKWHRKGIEWNDNKFYQKNLKDLLLIINDIENQGDKYYNQNDFRNAIEQYKQICDENDKVLIKLGKCYDKLDLHYTKAMDVYNRAAELDNVEAMYLYGKDALFGEYEKSAVKWLTKAASLNHAPSQFELSKYLRRNEDIKQADYWLNKAVASGYKEAKEEKSLQEAITLLENKDVLNKFLAEKKRDELGERYNIGLAYSKEGNYVKAVEICLPIAEEGLPEAQNFMGVAYHYGQGVAQNINMAIQWYDKAIAQGYKLAETNKNKLLSPPKTEKKASGWDIAATVLQGLADGVNAYNQISQSQRTPKQSNISTPNSSNNNNASWEVQNCSNQQQLYNKDAEQVKYWMTSYKDQWITYYRDKAAGKTGPLYNINVTDQFKKIQHFQSSMKCHRKICPSIPQSELETITPKAYIKKHFGLDVDF
jgi:hypothetical protein